MPFGVPPTLWPATLLFVRPDEPSQWRVENSWGDDHGDKGYSLLKKKWFREYVYEIAVHTDLLSDEHKVALSKKPDITLPPWDPMGALA